MNLLYGLAYSPWTERARWALDYAGVEYGYREHLLILGIPALRFAAQRFRGDITVPLLVTPRRAIMDSFEIALHAAQAVPTRSLITPDCASWTQVCEEGLDSGRALAVSRMQDDRASHAALTPRFIPSFMRGPTARLGLRYITSGFGIRREDLSQHRKRLRQTLLKIRERNVADAAQRLRFSDLASASVIQMISPPGAQWMRISRAYRHGFSDPELAAEFSDLVAWRDALYLKHRGLPASASDTP